MTLVYVGAAYLLVAFFAWALCAAGGKADDLVVSRRRDGGLR